MLRWFKKERECLFDSSIPFSWTNFIYLWVLQRCHTHLTCIKNRNVGKKWKLHKKAKDSEKKKRRVERKNNWPKNDTDFISFEYLRTEIQWQNGQFFCFWISLVLFAFFSIFQIKHLSQILLYIVQSNMICRFFFSQFTHTISSINLFNCIVLCMKWNWPGLSIVQPIHTAHCTTIANEATGWN